MGSRLRAWSLTKLDLRADELTRVLPLVLAYGLILASLYLLKPARNALFLNHLGIGQLPYVLLLVAGVGGVAASVYGRLSRTVGIQKLVSRTLLSQALILAGFRLLLMTGWLWTYYAFYIWVALYGLLTTSLIWLLANAAFTSREARRVFGLIGTGGIAGAILGGLFTGQAVQVIGTENLLWVCAGLLVVCQVLLHRVQPIESAGRPSKRDRKLSGPAALFSSNLLRNLAFIAALIATVAVVVDIQFNEIVDRAYPDMDAKTAFFGDFFAYLSIFSFVFQLVATPILLRVTGVSIALMILPLAMGLGSTTILLVPGLIAGIVAKGADGGFRHSVHKAASEVLFLPVPSEIKREAKLFLDTTIDTLFTGLGALAVMLLTGPLALTHDQLSWFSLPCIFLVLFLAIRLRRAYVDAFREALESRRINLEDLRVNLSEPGVIDALLPNLDSPNERQISYVLEVLASARSKRLIAPVSGLLTHDSANVRRRALVVLQGQSEWPDRAQIEPLLDDDDPRVRIEALTLLCKTHDKEADNIVKTALASPDTGRQTAALGALAHREKPAIETFLSPEQIEAFLAEKGPAGELLRAELAQVLADAEDPRLKTYFQTLTQDPSSRVVSAAIAGLARRKDESWIPWLLERLKNRELRAEVRRTLAAFSDAAVPALVAYAHDPNAPARRYTPRIFDAIATQKSVDALLDLLADQDAPLHHATIKALAKLRTANPHLRFDAGLVQSALEQEIEHYYETLQLVAVLPSHPECPKAALLSKALQERKNKTLNHMFLLLGLRYDPLDMMNAYQGVTSDKQQVRASALEFLDNVLRRRLRELILPALDHASMDTLREQARTLLGYTIQNRKEAFTRLLNGSDPWLRSCALFAATDAERTDHRPLFEAATDDPHPWVQETATRVLDDT